MTARDYYGHTAIDKSGKVYALNRNENPPKDWVVRYHFSEEDGWSFIRHGSDRQTILEINPVCSSEDVKKALDAYKQAIVAQLPKGLRKEQEGIISTLEKMIETKEFNKCLKGD